MPDTYPVKAVDASGKPVEGEFEAWEETEEEDKVRLELRLAGQRYEAVSDDFFSAMASIRAELEREGWRLWNYGSSKNVFPSPMSRSMGGGTKAYRLKSGEPAKASDLVSIFDSGPDIIPSTVAEQEAFYQAWLESLRKGKG